MKQAAMVLLALMLCIPAICSVAEADSLGVSELTSQMLPGSEDGAPVDLFLGPTGQFKGAGEQVDTSNPFLYFGQADCWAMVGTGTPEAPGLIGWIPASAALLPEEPLLLFEDAVSVTAQEDTFLTTTPLAQEAAQLMGIPQGTSFILLAHLGDWGYVQIDPEDAQPVRAFVPLQALQ